MSIPLSDAAALALSLQRGSQEPLSLQLARQLAALDCAGRIGEGARLPATRPLAEDLGVSRSTIIEAYDQLVAEGYLGGRRGSGMFVNARLAALEAKPSPTPPLGRPNGGGRRGRSSSAQSPPMSPRSATSRARCIAPG